MTNSETSAFRKPVTVFIKSVALLAAVVIVMGIGASVFIKVDPKSWQTMTTDTQQIVQARTQRGQHATRATQEKDSGLALLSWGGATLICAAAFFGIAHRIHSTFGVKDNEP